MIKHTPGPWILAYTMGMPVVRAGPIKQYARGSGQEQLVSIMPLPLYDEETPDSVEARRVADARLIAAAPDLLKALKALFANGAGVSYAQFTHEQHMAFEAIQKAEGES